MKKFLLICGLALVVLASGSALAATPPEINLDITQELPGQGISKVADLKDNTIPATIKYVGNAAVALAVLAIVYGGFLYLSARGQDDKIKKAHTTIMMSIIALVVVIFAWTLVNLVLEVFFK